jgi:uncharacterized protein (DUF2236 family)
LAWQSRCVVEDLGLFGPGSVTWRVHAEPILWFAGYRALLLQTLHPVALAGVLQNSNFREDPWGRLYRTARFYGEVVYGSTEQARKAGSRVRRIHARLAGTDPDTGATFRVDNPDLLRWIYVTATESFCDTARRAGLGLTAEEVDRYYDEQRAVAEMVGLSRDDVPATAAEIEAYYDDVRPQLRAGADARSIVRFLATPTLPWGLGWTPVRPMWIGVSAYAFSLLPAWARRIYGTWGLPTTDLVASLTSRTLRTAIRAVPTRALQGPLYRAAIARAERALAVSTTRKAGDKATISKTRAPGTTNARRRSPSMAGSASTPITADPTITPA